MVVSAASGATGARKSPKAIVFRIQSKGGLQESFALPVKASKVVEWIGKQGVAKFTLKIDGHITTFGELKSGDVVDVVKSDGGSAR